MSSSLPQNIVTPTLWLDANNSTEEGVVVIFQGVNQSVTFQNQAVNAPESNMMYSPDVSGNTPTETILIPASKIIETINNQVVPAISFSGKTPLNILESDKFQTKPLYVFIVSKVTGGSLLESVNGSNNWSIKKEGHNIKVVLNGDDSPFELAYHALDADHCNCISLTTVTLNTHSLEIFQNGKLLCSSSSATNVFTGSNNSLSINCSGSIYEVLVYDTELSASQKGDIEQYVSSKWNY